MPPWLPEERGGHGEFANERRLRDDQIALIQRWVAAGAPEGDSGRPAAAADVARRLAARHSPIWC